MLFLRKPERKNLTVFQILRSLFLQSPVVTHPDRSDAQNRYLVGIPVTQAVKTQGFCKIAYQGRIPPRIPVTIFCIQHHGREHPFLLHEFNEVGIPVALVEILLEFRQPLVFKKTDGFLYDFAGFLSRNVVVIFFWI